MLKNQSVMLNLLPVFRLSNEIKNINDLQMAWKMIDCIRKIFATAHGIILAFLGRLENERMEWKIKPEILIFFSCKLVSMALIAWKPVTSIYSLAVGAVVAIDWVYFGVLLVSCLKQLRKSEHPYVFSPSDMVSLLLGLSRVSLLYLSVEKQLKKSPAKTAGGCLFPIF